MYLVKLDGETFYDPRVKVYTIVAPTLKLEVNKSGSFDFKVYPSHPLFDRINKLKSTVEVYRDSDLLFRGRVLDDELDIDNGKKVVTEGELAYFNDTILRPYAFEGSVEDYLRLIIDQHNSQVGAEKQFTVGRVTVTDPNDYIVRSDSSYPNSWDVVEDKLISSLGGYLQVRREAGTNYLDYLADSSQRSSQTIELGKNMLDLARTSSASELYTAILPLGADLKNDDDEDQQSGERLTIESVNAGQDYIQDDEAVTKYGFIVKVQEWKDVTIADNLLTKARKELTQAVKLNLTLELTAVDLSLTNAAIDHFQFFDYVRVRSAPHNVDELMLIKKQELHLDDPSKDKLTLGIQRKSLTDNQVSSDKRIQLIGQSYTPQDQFRKVAAESKQSAELLSGTEIVRQEQLKKLVQVEAGWIQLAGKTAVLYGQVSPATDDPGWTKQELTTQGLTFYHWERVVDFTHDFAQPPNVLVSLASVAAGGLSAATVAEATTSSAKINFDSLLDPGSAAPQINYLAIGDLEVKS